MPLRPCLTCGELAAESWCIPHHPRNNKAPSKARGYDSPWNRLSRRARALSPFCETCGTTADLTGDHSREAWERHEAGLPIRLEDVRVLCRSCNARAGKARP